jgi:hypothetical protein
MRIVRTLAMVLLFAACSSDSPTENHDNGAGKFAARVDGQTWSAEFVEALYIGNVFSVSGNDGDLNITLSVAAQGTGTYDLTAGSAAGVIAEGSDAWYAVGLGGSGTITVTSLDAHGAKGTFAFTGGPVPGGGTTGTRTVTQGTFDVTF